MSDSAATGVLVYAKNLNRVSLFYERVLTGAVLHADAEHKVLQSNGTQLIVHAIPPHIADSILIDVPPAPREEQAIKPFFTLENLAVACEIAAECGGMVCGPAWRSRDFLAQNVCDPEGNIIQLRERAT